jgi:hypothetical protein
MTWRAKNTASSPTTRVCRMTPQGVHLRDVLTHMPKPKLSWLRRLWRWFWGPGLHR